MAINWFFAGHRNKLTLDASRLRVEALGETDLAEDRVRLQWDVSRALWKADEPWQG